MNLKSFFLSIRRNFHFSSISWWVFFQSRVTRIFTTFKFAVNGFLIHYWSFAVTTSLFSINEVRYLKPNHYSIILSTLLISSLRLKSSHLPTFKDNRSLMDTAGITTRKPSGEILCCTKLNFITSSFYTSESFWQDWKCKKDLKPM